MSTNTIELVSATGEIIRGIFQEPFNLSDNLLNPALMIFLHGFPHSHMKAHNDLFGQLQDACAKSGIASIRFDFRGCGISDGASENFMLSSAQEDIAQILEWSRTKFFDRYMFTAEGLGATCMMQQPHLEKKIHAAAFFWPVLDSHDYAIQNFDADRHKPHFEKEEIVKINDTGVSMALIKTLYDTNLVEDMNQIEYPCLIQHGAQDEIVAIEHLDLARAHFRNRRIEITTYQDGSHGLLQDNHRKNLLYHFEQFVQKYI